MSQAEEPNSDDDLVLPPMAPEPQDIGPKRLLAAQDLYEELGRFGKRGVRVPTLAQFARACPHLKRHHAVDPTRSRIKNV